MVGVIGRRRRDKIMGAAKMFLGGLNHSEEDEDKLGARVKDIEYVRRK